MNKENKFIKKLPLIRVLSLGLLVLGIACFLYAISNIFQEHIGLNLSGDNYDAGSKSLEVSSASIDSEPKKAYYPEYPIEGDNIGTIYIPALNRDISIYQGTNKAELKKGVGHFLQSVLPGEEDNCVISGHRDTVFSELHKLLVGDELIVETSAGTFTYEVSATRIVEKDDKTVIVPTDHGVLTLTTCYPFYFVGNAPKRYIVSADLVVSDYNSIETNSGLSILE